ncbi:MAG: hypothetical protein LUI12_03335 [Clostridiales bacterium]|nr:hypothetical protein [Clostridiales bacterium]
MKFDFTKEPIAQDMIFLLMKEKGLTKEDAVSYAINMEIADSILSEGWASIALPIWGHGNPDREFNILDNPVIEVELSELQKKLLKLVAEQEKVTKKEALEYFILFTMRELGYHI